MGRDAATKALWLRVRLVGRAQTAFKRLSAEDSAEYSKAIPRLREPAMPLNFKIEGRDRLKTGQLSAKTSRR